MKAAKKRFAPGSMANVKLTSANLTVVKELIAAVILLAAVLFGCFFLLHGYGHGWLPSSPSSDRTQRVTLTETEGLRVLSENPAPIRDGKAKFYISLEEGYRFSENEESKLPGSFDGRSTFTVETQAGKTVTVRLAHPVKITLGDSDKGTLLFAGGEEDPSLNSSGEDGIETVRSYYTDEKVTVRGAALEGGNYSFAGISVDGVVYPAGEDGSVTAVFERESLLEPVFLGKEVAVRFSAGLFGSVEERDGKEIYRYGDGLSLRAKWESSGYRFLGWSSGGYLKDGGELLSADADYRLELLGDSEIYANFEASTLYPLQFSIGEGHFTGDERLPEKSYSPGEYVTLPVDQGIFAREGFRCIGFAESPVSFEGQAAPEDIAALEAREDFHSFGGMLLMPARAVTLYAVYLPETDPSLLSFREGRDSAAVLGLSPEGKAAKLRVLVLPSLSPRGKPVVTVAENAFAGNGLLEKVDLPAGMQKIEDGAFSGCSALTSLTLPETLRTLSGTAFAACPSLAGLRIHASLEKVFDIDYDSALADKYMRLRATASAEKRILLVGGSGSAYGYRSEMIEEAFPGYTVVNLGTAVNYGIRPLLSILKANCKPGDIILFAPEYKEAMYGAETDTMTSWQFLESNYDILRDIDLRENPVLLSKYSDYLSSKRRYLSSGQKKYNSIVYSRASFSPSGDLDAFRPSQIKSIESCLPYSSLLSDEGLAFMNEALAELREKGAVCYYSFPMAAMPEGKTAEDLRGAEKKFLKKLFSGISEENLTVISELSDYYFPQNYFYDSMYHATLAGAKLRTEQIILDLRAALA